MTGVAPKTAAIVNLGCKVNQSEVDAAARMLRSRGVAVGLAASSSRNASA